MLYRESSPKIRIQHDTASNGNFLTKEVDPGWELVENLAQSNGNYDDDHTQNALEYKATEKTHKKELNMLNEKLDKLLQAQQATIQVAHTEDLIQHQDKETTEYEEINYLQMLEDSTEVSSHIANLSKCLQPDTVTHQMLSAHRPTRRTLLRI